MIKRWPKRREFLVYYTLWRIFDDREFNLGEAIELLAPFFESKKVLTRLIKRLVRQGFLERVEPLRYKAKDLLELLDEATAIYLAKRMKRRGFTSSPGRGLEIIVPRRECNTELASNRLIKCN
ncbi:MAG: hypothetical protein ABWW69_04690 [Pyrodictiaceae archaeon]